MTGGAVLGAGHLFIALDSQVWCLPSWRFQEQARENPIGDRSNVPAQTVFRNLPLPYSYVHGSGRVIGRETQISRGANQQANSTPPEHYLRVLGNVR